MKKLSKKKPQLSKLVKIEFYHPDSRINFFMASHIFDNLIEEKKLKFYTYTSSGINHDNAYSPYHHVNVYDSEINAVSEALEADGWHIPRIFM